MALADTGTDPTLAKHANLGFVLDSPFSANPNGCDPVVGVFCYDIEFHGTASLFADLETDVAYSYDAAQLVPGGILPVQLAYTPTANASQVTISVSGTATIDFTGCANCPFTGPLTLASGSQTFTAPLDADPSVTVPGSSSTLGLYVGPFHVADLSVSTNLTLAPVAPGILPGLGGAAAGVGILGATLTSSPFLEWDAAGQSLNGTIQLPSSLSGGFAVSLSPLLHWVETSGDVSLNIAFSDEIKTAYAIAVGAAVGGLGCLVVDCTLDDPSPISLFSGGLGPIYQGAGLDTAIGDAVGGLAGPLIAGRVAEGFVPVPLFAPELPTVPPIPTTLGSVTFSTPGVAIAGAPAEAVLLGSSVGLTAVVSRGIPPFSYQWTKNGMPFASTPTINDVPAVGSTTYAVYVTDANGAISNTASVVVNVYDFSIVLSPPSQTIPYGAWTTYSLSVVLTGGAGLAGVPTSVSTTLTGLPSGASAPGFPSSLPLGTTLASVTFTVDTEPTTPEGTYTLIASGITSTGSKPATAELVIISPAQATQNLMDAISAMAFPNGVQTSLLAPLSQAVEHITAGKYPSACGKLAAFVSLVNTYVGAGKLTQSQANELLLLASQIQTALGCI